jgi:alpha-L-fucosidase
MKHVSCSFAAIILVCAMNLQAASPPEPFGPLPHARQLDWHQLGYYAFVHFNMNTFTDREWGEGTESPSLFNPEELDCRQWARIFKDAGMKGIIITAKHHDGFCLWPSKYTEHSVKNSPWRDGQGDLLAELSKACKEYGLKFGVYLSPWDRNQPVYGDSPKYNQYFLNQLEEVLTNYGEVFEVWFDGACGEGPNGKRQVYDWPAFIAQVRKYAPNAVIFSDAGPDIRWVGNEGGDSSETTWAPLRRDEFYPGIPGRNKELGEGHVDGTHWLPPEVDVSIRPGWYYHAAQDNQQKSVDRLMQIYLNSWGNNGSLLLNIPVDRRGLVHENDARRLMEFKAARDAVFSRDLAAGKPVSASNTRGDDPAFAAGNTVDQDPDTYWAADDDQKTATLEIALEEPTPVNYFLAQEYIPLGQRIAKFNIAAHVEGNWVQVAEGTTIGNRKVVRFPTVTADAFRLEITDALACPTIHTIELFAAPPTARIEVAQTEANSPIEVTLRSDTPGSDIVYTLNGSDPDAFGIVYQGPFLVDRSATVKARAFHDGRGSIIPAIAELTIKKE